MTLSHLSVNSQALKVVLCIAYVPFRTVRQLIWTNDWAMTLTSDQNYRLITHTPVSWQSQYRFDPMELCHQSTEQRPRKRAVSVRRAGATDSVTPTIIVLHRSNSPKQHRALVLSRLAAEREQRGVEAQFTARCR